MTLIEPAVFLATSFASTAGAQEGWMIGADHHRLHLPPLRKTDRGEILADAVFLAEKEEPPVLHGRPVRDQVAQRAVDEELPLLSLARRSSIRLTSVDRQ